MENIDSILESIIYIYNRRTVKGFTDFANGGYKDQPVDKEVGLEPSWKEQIEIGLLEIGDYLEDLVIKVAERFEVSQTIAMVIVIGVLFSISMLIFLILFCWCLPPIEAPEKKEKKD